MRFEILRKELAAVAFAKKLGCKGPLPEFCSASSLPKEKWCAWCKAKSAPPRRGGGGFKDEAHTTDKVAVGLSTDPSGRCKGPSASVGMSCVETEYPREQWCSYCKAKNPSPVLN